MTDVVSRLKMKMKMQMKQKYKLLKDEDKHQIFENLKEDINLEFNEWIEDRFHKLEKRCKKLENQHIRIHIHFHELDNQI